MPTVKNVENAATNAESTKTMVTLNIEVGFDEHKKPVCCAPEINFQCRALRPKTYNALGNLVHYCGLGARGQLPLRETSVKRGIVRPNKACPLHQTPIVKAKDEAKTNLRGVLMTPPKMLPPSSLYQLGRLASWYLYVDASDFGRLDIRAMEQDVSLIFSNCNIGLEADPEQLLVAICDILHPHFTKWQSVTFQKVVLTNDGYCREGIRVLPNWNTPSYCGYEEPKQFYVYTHTTPGSDSFYTFRTEFTPEHLLSNREESVQQRKALIPSDPPLASRFVGGKPYVEVITRHTYTDLRNPVNSITT